MKIAKRERSAWDRSVIKIGQITLSLVIIAGFLPSLFLYFFYGVEISLSQMVTATLSIWVVYGAFYPVEPLAYYPSLGLAGTYMGWLAGNVGNMRVPSAVLAKQANEVEDGTPEAEICTVMGIAGSIIINLIILTIGVLAGSRFMSMLPEVVTTALNNYLLPGVFGGMFGLYGTKYPKIAVPCFIVIVILNYLSSNMGLIPSWLVLIIAVFGSLGFTRILYKTGKV